MLRLALLGPPQITLNEQPVTGLPSRAAEALLIYLACNPGVHPRESLAELLWHDRETGQALANLRTILTPLRKQLGDYLLINRRTLAFNSQAPHWLDIQHVEEQPDLVRGEYLQGFHLSEGRGFDEWLLIERERQGQAARRSLLGRVEALQLQADYASALGYARRLAALDPFDEQARRLLIELFARTGQRNAALREYESLRVLLNEELGVEPVWATESLKTRIRSLPFPPPARIPAYPAPFVGRETELAELLDLLLARGERLVTISGLGGSGKTRFAVEALRKLSKSFAGRFWHGVFFIQLAALADPNDLPARIADGIGFAVKSGPAAQAERLDYLREKEMLIALDNFEHLLKVDGQAAVDPLIAILAECPGLKLLVTSRERLDLTAERLFPLSGLDYPAGEGAAPHKTGAQRLFLQAARRALPGFEPSPADREQITHITRLVDGSPLGIELAAGSMRASSCSQIADRLQAGPAGLTASARDAPERHRSLQTVFEYSWELLSEDEKPALRSAALFRDAFDSSAAAAVIGPAHEAALAGLLDKSLLASRQPGWFFAHPLIRVFALEKLVEDPAAQQLTEAAYAAYFARMLAGFKPELETGAQTQILERMAGQRDDIRAAWEWAAAHEEAALLDQMLDACYLFALVRDGPTDWIERFGRAAAGLAKSGDASDMRAAARIAARKAALQFQLGAGLEGRPALEENLRLARAAREAEEIAFSLLELAKILRQQSESEAPRRMAAEARALCLEKGLTAGAAQACYAAGLFSEEDIEQAHAYYEESLHLYRSLSSPRGIALALTGLGGAFDVKAQPDQARPLYEEVLSFARRMQDRNGIAGALNQLAGCLVHLGRLDEAWEAYSEGLEIARDIGNVEKIGVVLNNLGWMCELFEDYGRAHRYYRESLNTLRGLGNARQIPFLLVNLGSALINLDRLEEAKAHLLEAKRSAGEDRPWREALLSHTYRLLGELTYLQGDDESAQAYFLDAIRISDYTPLKMLALTETAIFWERRGRAPEAFALAGFIQGQEGSSSQDRKRAEGVAERARPALKEAQAAELEAWGKGKSVEDVTAAVEDGAIGKSW